MGGLSQYLDIDASMLRLAAVFLMVITGFLPLFLTYVVAWIIIPEG